MDGHELSGTIAQRWPRYDVVTARELEAAEIGNKLRAAAVSRGIVHRLRRGAYVRADLWDGAGIAARDLMRIHAHILTTPHAGVYSHVTAARLLGVPVPYDADIDGVSDLILSSARELQRDPVWAREILDDPEIWGVQALSGESITIRLVFRTQPLQQWAVARAMRARLKVDLDSAGVRIPLVQQTVIRSANPVGFTTEHADPQPDHAAQQGSRTR